MDRGAALANYRAKRTAYYEAAVREDAAFVRWFTKRTSGQATNGAAAARLANGVERTPVGY